MSRTTAGLLTAGCWLLMVSLQGLASDAADWWPLGPLAVLAGAAWGASFMAFLYTRPKTKGAKG